MKNKISVSAILAMGFLIFLIYGSKTIYGMRNQVVASEETLIGNVKEANDVKLTLKYMDNSDIGWDIDYHIDNSIKTDAIFNTYYYNVYRSNFAPNISMNSDEVFHSNSFSDKIEEDVGEITILLADYYEYLPVRLWASYDSKMSTEVSGEDTLFRIKIPEDAAIRIKKEYNSYSTENILVPYVYNLPSGVVIDDKLYFTITNLSNQLMLIGDRENGKNNIEYNITSGILALDKKDKLTYEDIEMIYPINLENEGTVTVLGLTSVKDDKFLVLATLEEQNIYIHLYDIMNNILVGKEKVGEIPKSMGITRFEIVWKEEHLLANYEYMEEGTQSRDTLQVIGAVYTITDSNEIKSVFENEYYSKLVKEINENYYTDPKDMLFINNKLHLIFNNYSNTNNTDGKAANSIVLLTMDKEDILYLGIVRNSMIEDYTIGDVNYIYHSMNNEELIVGNRYRNISSIKFSD